MKIPVLGGIMGFLWGLWLSLNWEGGVVDILSLVAGVLILSFLANKIAPIIFKDEEVS